MKPANCHTTEQRAVWAWRLQRKDSGFTGSTEDSQLKPRKTSWGR